MKRLPAALGLAVGFGIVLALLWEARGRAGCADCLPSLDMADYLGRALRLRGAWLVEGPAAAAREALRADVHPPGHPLLLAGWFALGARGLEQVCALTNIELALALLGLVLLGRALDRERGAWAGLLAAGMTALCGEHQRLATPTMTESLALCATVYALWALAAQARAGGAWRALGAGVLIAMTGLVRYNIPPMLLAPALASGLLARIRAPRAPLRPDALLLVAPTALTLAAWWALEPKLPVALARFLTNVDSGLDPWSAENLLWTPRSIAEHYLLSPSLALAWGLAALAGLAMAWRPAAWRSSDEPSYAAIRLLQLFVLAGLAAITLHPYKLARALHGVVPLLLLVGALPLARLPLPQRLLPRAAILAGVAALLGLGVRIQRQKLDAPETLGRLECMPADKALEALDAIVAISRGRRLIAVSGSATMISAHAIELWLRLDDPRRDVSQDPPTPPDCGKSDAWPLPDRCVGDASKAAFAAPEMASGDALVIAIEKGEAAPLRPNRNGGRDGGRRKLRQAARGEHWSLENANVVARLAAEAGVPMIAELEVHGGLARVKVYGRE